MTFSNVKRKNVFFVWFLKILIENFERLYETLTLTILRTLKILSIFADYDVDNNLMNQMNKQQIGIQKSIQKMNQINKFSFLEMNQTF